MADAGVIETALKALRSESRLGPHFKPDLIRVESDGALLIEGEVDSVAQKRLALERVAALPDVNGIIDRLHVQPATVMSDSGILDHLRKALIQEPMFMGTRIAERREQEVILVRDATNQDLGAIEIEVHNGIITLNGSLPSLASKRLAGVLAWWIPGSRDVINGIAVTPPEEDAPIRMEEAVRIALEKDPLIAASQIRVGARGHTVRLTGLVASHEASNAAEADAWFVFGVDDVINEIEVRP